MFKVVQYDSSEYEVKTPVYSGPLDLLLDLIESAELDITVLALAQVTEQYLTYLNTIREQDPGQVSAFLVIAAKLLQIKSAALLPKPPSEISSNEEDPGEELARQLREYKQYKKLSQFFKDREESNYRSFIRLTVPRPNIDIKPDLSELTMEALIEAAKEAFSFRDEISMDEVVNIPKVTIKQKISNILDILRSTDNRTVYFHTMTKELSRIEIVISFLAMLELYKQRVVTLHQDALFGVILIEGNENLDAFQMDQTEFIDS
jgi:segregation and condensation protein A